MFFILRNSLLGFLLFQIALNIQAFNAEDTLCATVKIEISQELTLERQAFEATMRINNSLDSFELNNIGVDLVFRDEDDKPVIVSSDASASTADFYVRLDDTTGIGG